MLVSVCWVPQASYLTEVSASNQSLIIPPCLTDESTQCMTNHLLHGVIVSLDQPKTTNCSKPCSENYYVIETRYKESLELYYT